MVDIQTLAKSLFDSIRHQSRMTHSGVVIASAAILDNQLERVLKKAMRPLSKKMHKRLFESFGPLSDLASKILMAYALRIISVEIYDELEKIRQIRNEFAHSSEILNFDSKQIAPKFLALKKPQTSTKNPPEIFVKCVTVIHEFLEAYLVRMGEPHSDERLHVATAIKSC